MVPNFHRVHGQWISRSPEGAYRGRTHWDLDEWSVSIDDLDSADHAKVRDVGGFALSHVVTCQRKDGAPFSPESIEDEWLRDVDLALSFCLGRWTGAVLLTGHDETGVPVWEKWRLPWVAPYSAELSWFPNYPTAALDTFVPLFLWSGRDPVAKHAISTCVHWYIEANAGHGGLEGAIVMALMALELLAWLEIVNRQGGSPKAFDAESLHEKLRRYLSAKNISVTCAPLRELTTFVNAESCADGLEGATRIRNRTVHPPKQAIFPNYSMELLEEVWRFSVYLLERAILAEIGYVGAVWERLGRTFVNI